MNDELAPDPAATDPVTPARPRRAGPTTSRATGIRAGVLLGTALVVAIGAAVTMGASKAPATVGARPLAAASGSPEPAKGPEGHGFGHGGFGGFGPFAGGGKPDRTFGHGRRNVTIAAIDGTRLSLATDDGWTRTITLTATTTITRGGAAAAASDLHVGDAIRFRQHRETDGSFTITAIDVVLPQVVGTITDVSGNTLTLLDRDGATVTVHVATTTKIRVRGIENATTKDLTKGHIALVVGEKRSDGSIDATGILSGTLREPKPGKANGPKDGPGVSSPEASGQPG